MGASDFQLGYQAYWRDEPLDETRTSGWQDGWLTAEAEDYDDFLDDDLYYGED